MPSVEVSRGSVARSEVGFASPAPAVQVNRAGSVSFEMAVKGLATSASAAVEAVAPVDMSDFVSSIMTQDLDTGDTTTGVSGGVAAVSTGTRFSVGSLILFNTGEVAQIRSISTNNLTLGTSHIATEADVTTGTTVYAGANYRRKTTGFNTFCFDYFRGGLFRQVMHGCLPTVNLSITRDQVVKFAFAYTAGEAHEYTLTTPVAVDASLPIGLTDTTVPFDGKAARCLLGGVNVLVQDLSLNLGFAPVMRNSLTGPNQADGLTMTLQPITGSFTILADEDDRASFEDVVDRMNRSAQVDFLYQKGTAPGNTFAFCIPAMQVTAAPQSYSDGQGVYQCTFQATLPQTTPGNAFDSALPDFSMAWM